MKMGHIFSELWTKPVLMRPETHRQLCEIAMAHFTGAAHAPNGIATLYTPTDEGENEEPDWTLQNDIAVIPIDGIIGKRVSAMRRSSGIADVDNIERAITGAALHPSVRGIMLDISSPGGTVTGMPELADVIRDVSEDKAVAAYTDSEMTSAAYWLASQADLVWAAPSATVGSIGVYMAWLDTSRAQEFAGIKTELIKRGKFKAAGIPGLSLSDDQREMLDGQVARVYGWFVDAVRRKRERIPDSALEGQVFYGADAEAVDMVDGVGSRSECIAALKKQLDIRAKYA